MPRPAARLHDCDCGTGAAVPSARGFSRGDVARMHEAAQSVAGRPQRSQFVWHGGTLLVILSSQTVVYAKGKAAWRLQQ